MATVIPTNQNFYSTTGVHWQDQIELKRFDALYSRPSAARDANEQQKEVGCARMQRAARIKRCLAVPTYGERLTKQ